MDIASLIGFLGAVVLMILPMAQGVGIGDFVDVASVQIVFGGSLMVLLMRSQLSDFIAMWAQVFAKIFTAKIDDPKELIEQITELAQIVRKDGMIALEGQDIANPFLAKGVAMMVDSSPAEVVTATLENDNDLMKVRHETAVQMWVSWADIAPAMGMIGTLIGLVGMLQNMSDPKAIGPAMAVALLTTMYGAIIANVLAKPVSEKLAAYSQAEQLNNDLIMQAVDEIAKGTNPRVISDVLASRLPPKIRAELVEA